ncbi:hypothetical protein CRUP_007842 [Coryphaenoides rupestris]|nr:hypothetical protein CRUP_007842 [Coryphaenoides rupestris]
MRRSPPPGIRVLHLVPESSTWYQSPPPESSTWYQTLYWSYMKRESSTWYQTLYWSYMKRSPPPGIRVLHLVPESSTWYQSPPPGTRVLHLAAVCPEACPLVLAYLLAAPQRTLLLHGPTHLKTGLQTQERHLFLFRDMLLVTKAKAVNHFKLKAQVRLNEMWAGGGSVDEVCEGSSAPDHAFVMGWPTCNYVAAFSSSEQKEQWLSLLKR